MNAALIKRLEKSEKAAAAMLKEHELTENEFHAYLLDLGIDACLLGLTPEQIELARSTPLPKLPPRKPMSEAELDARMRELGLRE